MLKLTPSKIGIYSEIFVKKYNSILIFYNISAIRRP